MEGNLFTRSFFRGTLRVGNEPCENMRAPKRGCLHTKVLAPAYFHRARARDRHGVKRNGGTHGEEDGNEPCAWRKTEGENPAKNS